MDGGSRWRPDQGDPVTLPGTDPHLQLLAVTLMDIRATVESMLRSVVNAQSSVEVFRHTSRRQSLEDISDCVEQLLLESAAATESAQHAREPLKAMLDASART